MSEVLSKDQLRRVADYLYDGHPEVLHLMSQVRAFSMGDRVLLWFCRNQIRGGKFIEFFKDESGNDNSRGVMLGVQKVINILEGRKNFQRELTAEDLS